MKFPSIIAFVVLSSLISSIAPAQNNWDVKNRNYYVEMLFPKGVSKALVLSYDDGAIEDRKLVELLNKYELKGTFHLNSGRFGKENIISADEVKNLFEGHEISIHGYNHQGMKNASEIDFFYEIGEDRRILEQLSRNMVRGMAYPFGSYDKRRLNILSGLGLEYARTVEDSYNFEIPENFLLWHPTIHKFGKAGYMGNKPENDQKELDIFSDLTQKFLETDQAALYYVWGHSWEYKNKWNLVEDFFRKVANNESVWYATHIELVDYINAYRSLIISADKTMFQNLSTIDVFIRVSDFSDLEDTNVRVLKVPAGGIVRL